MPEEETETKKSKYSSGIAKEIRRNVLWTDANNHSRIGQYSKWNEDLDRIWCELSSDAEKKKLFTLNKLKYEEFDKQLASIGNFNDNVHTGFEKPSNEEKEKRSKHYKKLIEKEIFLRLLEEDVGKGTSWEEDEEDEF
jgi:hypothetical protein